MGQCCHRPVGARASAQPEWFRHPAIPGHGTERLSAARAAGGRQAREQRAEARTCRSIVAFSVPLYFSTTLMVSVCPAAAACVSSVPSRSSVLGLAPASRCRSSWTWSPFCANRIRVLVKSFASFLEALFAPPRGSTRHSSSEASSQPLRHDA
jgi:hypothetical protein